MNFYAFICSANTHPITNHAIDALSSTGRLCVELPPRRGEPTIDGPSWNCRIKKAQAVACPVYSTVLFLVYYHITDSTKCLWESPV